MAPLVSLALAHDRDLHPSAGVIDSQTVKGADTVGADSRGCDAGKKINRRKRFIVTDTLGLLVTVWILAASWQDRDGARGALLPTVAATPIWHVFADQGFTGRLVDRTATIDAWYSGKHRDFGANIQAVMRPDGLPIWTSDAMPGHLHDLTCAQRLDVTGALYWTASELRLRTLADSGYEVAGQAIHPVQATRRRPAPRGRQPHHNTALRSMRCLGERGFAILTGRWRTLVTAPPAP